MPSPRTIIIFCHYGNSGYLYYTLKQVRLTNPRARVVLLGDEANRKIALKAGAEHYRFEDFGDTDEGQEFENVYQHVAGEEHGKEFWTKFVFRRWFYVHGFLKQQGIRKFWHFDSDNMILVDLEKQENKFRDYDCTEQCGGMCMNGFISSFEVVDGYVKKINELFKDEAYLDKQRQDFIEYPKYAFTEMRAYATYKEQENVKSIQLSAIIDNECFDDCICQEDGFLRYARPVKKRLLKKLFLDAEGHFNCYHSESKTYIKMNSLNLSWVPDDLFLYILKYTSGDFSIAQVTLGQEDGYHTFDVFRRQRLSILKSLPKKLWIRLFGKRYRVSLF